jgi:sugar lactone lactonase YvrE
VRAFLIILYFVYVCVNVQAQTGIITTIAGNGNQGFAGDGGLATNAEFDHPYQLCQYKNSLYIDDGFNHRIRKIDLSTGIITTVAGTGTVGYNGDNILATNAQLYAPQGVCTDTSGNIYIADGGNYRVRKVTVATGIITTIIGNGIMGYSGDGGSATNAKIGQPIGLSTDTSGNIYFGDGDNFVVRKLNPTGIIQTIAGNGTPGYTGDNGQATNAQLRLPNKATVDNFGNVIISDGQNYVIRKVNAISGTITTIAGNGTSGYFGDGSLATNALLSSPTGGFVDKFNNFYFSDGAKGVIRRIDAVTGIITTVVGMGVQGFSGDGGPATNAQLRSSDVCLDTNGTMYISDYLNYRIRKVYNPQLAVNTTKTSNELSVYPNPANDVLQVHYHFPGNEDAEFQITDVTGRVLTTSTLLSGRLSEQIDIRHLPLGLYLYRVLQQNQPIATGKFIKE